MLSVNDNLSFKANIVTTLKGRNNVMTKISESFKQQSKGVNGSLLIERAKGGEKGSVICKIAGVENSPVLYMDQSFLSKDAKVATPSLVDNVAERLFKVFQILKKELDFNSKVGELDKQIHHLSYVKKCNIAILDRLKLSGKNPSFTKIYENLVASNGGRLDQLVSERQKLKESLINDSKKIAGNEDAFLGEYLNVLSDVY